MYVRAEYHTSHGRIGMVLQSREYTYAMEFKLDGSAEAALRQINSKDYALPFSVDGTKLYRIGLHFSSETRNIDKWIIG